MISIVIPVFNGEKYLAECIESCLNQTYDDYEIIIVNDGSTDKTEEIINKFYYENPEKIQYVKKPNGGTASALNMGIKNMKGQWFKWLSADDMFYTKHALQDMIKAISTIPAHERFIFYTDYVVIDQDSMVIRPFDEPDRTKYGTDLRNVELMYNYYGNASSSLIHKSLIDKVGLFREGMPFGEDLEYWLRACIQHKYTMYRLPVRSIKYREHLNNITSNKSLSENVKQVQELKAEYDKYLTQNQRDHLKELYKSQPLRRKLIPITLRAKMLEVYRKIK